MSEQNPKMSEKKCPKCGCRLLTDNTRHWCVNGLCDFDTRKYLTEGQVYGNDCPNGICNV